MSHLLHQLWIGIVVAGLSARTTLAVIGGTCIPSGGAYSISSQATLDAIPADCLVINGSIDVFCNGDSTLVDFNAFRLVEKVTGFLRVESCPGLTNMTGFSSLKVIEGNTQYSGPGVGNGFVLYIADNSALQDLGGLQNLTSVGKGDGSNPSFVDGRVYISQNPLLCYSLKINWRVLMGEAFERLIYVIPGAVCTAESCNAQCSCDDNCFGPFPQNCQGVCDGDTDTETLIIVTLVLCTVVFAVVSAFFFLYITDRCGCRLNCFGKRYQFGAWGTSTARFSGTNQMLDPKKDSISVHLWDGAFEALNEENSQMDPDTPKLTRQDLSKVSLESHDANGASAALTRRTGNRIVPIDGGDEAHPGGDPVV
eukprot:m.18233 g.18233  ORF g.18233 m.18233 type:complete len:367 (+) comp11407_c0_seq1:251-1351(+)